ncbi:Glutathione S-transferase GST-6.0 [Hartmannibacter diazotrophicus]|uniref:Glutathione S-transferase GST-6.0 n=2 Tax=Hartmannibacter diazotrophicus TaxID=1482074 RepID=A0A2C9DA03_9HYPH|nr:Glutathione S-transferase GST-6.0 [Hartmannibacter diazotrophicus]
MKLYWCPQSRSATALWLMEEAGLPYERELIDIRKGDQSTDAFRAINPMMKVPALVDGEAQVAEVAAICLYVADIAAGAGLAPALGDPLRGRYLQYVVFGAAGIEAAITQLYAKFDMPTVSAGWGSAERVCDVLDGELQKGDWILGERFSAADIVVGSGLHFAVKAFKMVPSRPSFDAYIARCEARPAWQRARAIEAAGG